jgi:hypothetical protein
MGVVHGDDDYQLNKCIYHSQMEAKFLAASCFSIVLKLAEMIFLIHFIFFYVITYCRIVTNFNQLFLSSFFGFHRIIFHQHK